MGQIKSYFTVTGDPFLFSCPCGKCISRPHTQLLQMLNRTRELAGIPMTVNSGPRCEQYNIDSKGAKYSEHIEGKGADIKCLDSRSRMLIVRAAIQAGFTRIGIAKTFVHLGCSETNDQLVMWVYN